MTTPSPNRPHNKHRRHQRGAALLILMLLVMLGLITLFTFRMDRKGPELNADRKTAAALAQAKEALLGNSAINGIATASTENPGRLPCPNIDNSPAKEGVAASPPSTTACPSAAPGIPANMGRFPWKTLKMADLHDGAAERLWYVVDPNFVDTGAPMNSGISPTLAVNGNKVVAVIIAPGPALGALNQQRDTANQNNYRNYLESYINPVTVVLNTPSATYNDRIITITAKELFTVVTFRMARDLAIRNSPPYPSAFTSLSTSPAVWGFNNWTPVVTYAPNMTSTGFDLTFQNCAIIYTITGPTVTRHQSSC